MNNHSSYNYSARKVLDLMGEKDSSYWMRKRDEQLLGVFHEASKRVPAYKDFLKKNKVSPNLIKTIEDFRKVPAVSKKNYLRKYKLADLCWDGSLKRPYVFTATSGSTGESVYFVRGQQLDWQYSVLLERFLRERLEKKNGSVLVIVCFGMGLWIGGVITYKGFELAAQRNDFPVSIITPGLNKKEIFNALKVVAPEFKYTILAGYPPFIKDIIDEASEHGIDLKKRNVRLLFAAEAITEGYRDYVTEKAGINSMFRDTMSIYGSADIGAMAFESTISVLIRRFAREKKELFDEIFSPINKTPTLSQYNPLFINFEEQGGELLLTGDSAIPLVRYAIGDNGGVFSFDDAKRILGKHGLDLDTELRGAGIQDSYTQLPFVYVYERKDLSTTFYGLLVYPEWIKGALYEKPISDYLTGKFTLITKYDGKKDQYLELNLELKRDKTMTKAVEQKVMSGVMDGLRKSSSEFTEISNQMKNRAKPKLVFWPKDHQLHFAPGIKQKWTKQE